jgi:hypothetical protein
MKTWEVRKLIPETTWTYNATVRTILPTSGLLSALMIGFSATPVSDARRNLEKWRLIDYINEIKVLVNGSTVEKSMTGRIAKYLNWCDGGPAILDQDSNYAASTQRLHTCLNFGRYFKDEEFGLDLGRYDSAELQITNDAAVGQFTAFATPTIYGVFLKDAPSGTFKGHTRTEEYRKWTTVQAAVEYLRLQEEGRLRKIVFQVDPAVSAYMVPDTTLYNVLYNLRITHKAKSTELFNGNLRDLWYLNAFEDGRDVFQGAEPYQSDAYAFRTGLGQTLYKAAAGQTHSGTQSSYPQEVVAGEDSSTQTRQCDGDADQGSFILSGLSLENCAQWRYDTYGDLSFAPDMQAEKPIELEVTTRDSATADNGTIRIETDRIMIP